VDNKELLNRTKRFALEIIGLVEGFPKRKATDVIGRQMLRSATSVGANYRSALRARSRADFVSKLNIALEEADESLYWLELAVESGLAGERSVDHLLKEANEFAAIFTSSVKTLRKQPSSDP
jgi:four helix bundle protein